MPKYVSPALKAKSFSCNTCDTLSQQVWSTNAWFGLPNMNTGYPLPISRCLCVTCGAVSFWSDDAAVQIFPRGTGSSMPHVDLPADCVGEYMEARNVAGDSPRAAAALLRLCVQKLLKALGGDGKNIDADIASLVAKGLPLQVQQALDVCRVVGNNAVHPGEIILNDDPAFVGQLFELINFIVSATIEREKQIAMLVQKLPTGALNAIDKRNAKALSAAASPALPPAT